MFIISGWLPMYILIVRTSPHPVFCRLPYTNIAWEFDMKYYGVDTWEVEAV